LEVLRGFIDFVNREVGVYCDRLAGFEGNKVRIERQIPRVQSPVSRRIEKGQPVIVPQQKSWGLCSSALLRGARGNL
jgi:hypothetical protein